MSWPTVCKGIFNKGLNKGKSQGKSPSERSPQTVKTPAHTAQTAEGRMLYQASKPLTARSMRVPFGK